MGGNQEEIASAEKDGRGKAAVEERIKIREGLEVRDKAKSEKHLGDIRGIRRRDRKENVLYLHGPMDSATTLKLRFRVGDLALPEKRERYTSNREEGVDTQMFPCVEATACRTHTQ